MVHIVHFVSHVGVPISEFQLPNQIWKLFIQFHRFLKIFLIDLLSQMFVHPAFINNFLVNLSFALRPIALFFLLLLLLLILKTCKIQILMRLHKLLILNIRLKIHIVELLQLINLGPLMRKSMRWPLLIH